MTVQCEHNSKARIEGLCAKCKLIKPYMVFRYVDGCTKVGAEDRCCGYFWGSGREALDGQKCEW